MMPTWVTELYIKSSNICLLEGDFAWQLNSYNTRCKGRNSNLMWRNQLGNWASRTPRHCPLYLQVTEMCGRRAFTTYLCTWVRIGCPGIPATVHLVRTRNQGGSQLPESCNDTFWILRVAQVQCDVKFAISDWTSCTVTCPVLVSLWGGHMETRVEAFQLNSTSATNFAIGRRPNLSNKSWVKNPPLRYLL